jgi:hypothetical protein
MSDPRLALLVCTAFSISCAREHVALAGVKPSKVVTPAEQHAGAVGAALYSCVKGLPTATRRTYDPVWQQIRDARIGVGDRGVCVTAAALLNCNAGYPWYGVDRYLEDNPRETCQTLIAASDLSRAVRDSR